MIYKQIKSSIIQASQQWNNRVVMFWAQSERIDAFTVNGISFMNHDTIQGYPRPANIR